MLSNYISKYDFDKICRTCLKTNENMTSVFDTEVLNMLTTCTTISIEENDGLPGQICSICSNKIQESYSFRQESENCDRILRQVLINDEEKKLKWKGQDYDDKYDEKTPLDTEVDMKDEPDEYTGDDYDEERDDRHDSDENSDDSEDDDRNDLKSEDDLEFPPIHVPDPNNTNKKDSAWQKALQLGPDKCDPTTKTCKICKKVLYNVHSLVRHVETHDENRKYAIVCTICHKGFYEKQHIKNHMLRHKGEARYKCDECKKPFYELNALRVHAKRKHPERKINCKECNEEFLLQEDLDLHMKTHNEQQFECEDCGKTFHYRYRLREHQVMHSKERTFHCKQCDKSFKSKQVLHLHYKRCHSGEKKREVCNVCGKSVINLKNHIYIHNDEKYKCEQCSQEFTNKYVLEKHIKRKHGNLDETELNPYLCSICGKRSENMANLNRHYLTHSDVKTYKCPICDKLFKTNDLRNSHIRYTHNNERHFKCTECNKSFQTRSVLKKHIRTHTGERPYECELCGKAFQQRSTLKTHMKVHGYLVEKSSNVTTTVNSSCGKQSTTSQHHHHHHQRHHVKTEIQLQNIDV